MKIFSLTSWFENRISHLDLIKFPGRASISAASIWGQRVMRLAMVVGCLAVAGTGPSLQATTVVPPEFDQLVRESDFVVRAKVLSVNSEWLERGKSRTIVTKVELDVLEVIAGEADAKVTLTMLGGKIGEREMVIEGAPHFVEGEEDVLFVQGNGRQVVPLTAMMHGRYRVMRDSAQGRSYVARENGEPLTETAQVTQAMEGALPGGPLSREERIERALSPEEFAKRIRAVKPAAASISTPAKND